MLRVVSSVALAIVPTVAIIIFLSLLSSRVDIAAVTDSIRMDLKNGAVDYPTDWNMKTGTIDWADCIALETATYGENDFVSAIARAKHPMLLAETHPCELLDEKIGGPPQRQVYKIEDYWRFWLGSVAVLKIVIGFFHITLSSYQAALPSIVHFMILIMTGTALIRYRQAALPLLPIAFALTFGFETPAFSRSIVTAPELVTGLLLLSAYMIAAVDRAAPQWQFSYFAFAGGLQCYFDQLDGTTLAIVTCFVLIRLSSIRAFGVPNILWPARLALWPRTGAVLHMMLSYGAGGAAMVLFRIMLRTVLVEGNFAAVWSDWLAEISKHSVVYWPQNGISALEIADKFSHGLDYAAFPYMGRHDALLVFALCGLLYARLLIWSLRHWGKLEIERRDTLLATIPVVLLVPLYYALLPVLSIVHWWFTARLLSLFFALAPSIALMMLPNQLTWDLVLHRLTPWLHAGRQLALGIAPALTIILFVSLLSSRVDIAAVTDSIRMDLESGAVDYPTDWNIRTGTLAWADCTALEIATYGENDVVSVLARAKQPTIPTETHTCEQIEDKIGGPPQRQAYEIQDYWRFWWGSVAVLKIVIGFFHIPLSSYQATLPPIIYSMILIMTGAALIRYRQAALPLLPVAFALTFGFATPIFSQSIVCGPELATGLLLLSAYMIAAIDRAAPRWQFSYFAFAGALQCFFDQLDGTALAIVTCFGLIRLSSIRAFGAPKLLWPARLESWPRTAAVLQMLLSYGAGGVAMVLFRVILRTALVERNFDAVWSDWLAQISKHTMVNWSQDGVTIKEIADRFSFGLDYAAFPIVGKHAVLLVFVLCGLLYAWLLIWSLRHWRKLEIARRDALLATIPIILFVPLYYCLFPVLSITNWWFTARLLSLFFALAPSIALMMLPKQLTWDLFLPPVTLWKYAARQLALGIAAAVAITMSISLLSSRVDIAAVTDSIRTDVESGAVVYPTDWNMTSQTFDWADCMVLEMATNGENDVVSVLARANQPILLTETHPCEQLDDKIGGPPQRQAYKVEDYWRYWWGSVPVLKIVIGVFHIALSSYQAALPPIVHFLILIMTGAALIRYRQAALPLLPVAFALTFGFETPVFSQSIVCGLELVTGLLLLSAYMVAAVDRAALRWQFAFFAFAGGLQCYFDQLVGTTLAIITCFVLIRLSSMRAFGTPKILWPAWLELWPRTAAVLHMMLSYGAGGVAMVLFRMILRTVLVEGSLSAVWSGWLAEISKHSAANWPQDAMTVMEIVHKFSHGLDYAGSPYVGRHVMMLVFALCGLLYAWLLIWSLWHWKKLEIARRDTLLATIPIVLLVPLYYGLLPELSIVHWWFTARLLSLFFALAPSIALMMLPDQLTWKLFLRPVTLWQHAARQPGHAQ